MSAPEGAPGRGCHWGLEVDEVKNGEFKVIPEESVCTKAWEHLKLGAFRGTHGAQQK